MVYRFAERGLNEEDFKEINEKSQIFEDEQTAKGVQKHYLDILEKLEKKYPASAQA